MTKIRTWNIPLGICVECGRPIVGRAEWAWYCVNCHNHHRRHTKSRFIIDTTLFSREKQELLWLMGGFMSGELGGELEYRSEAVYREICELCEVIGR